MSEIVGKKMLIGSLYKFIDESKVGDKLIVLLLLVMCDKEILKVRVWRRISHGFLSKYRERIFSFCRFEENECKINRIKIEKDYRSLFFCSIGSMIRCGVITGCSYKQITKQIDRIFDTGYTQNTILNKLKTKDPDFEELENLIFSEKRHIKTEFDHNNK